MILAGAAGLLLGCTQYWNDLVHTEVVADVLAFSVEGQVTSSVMKYNKTVAVLLPWDADPAALTLSTFEITEGAVCTPALSVGGTIDLSEPLTLTLHTYDDYVWTVTATQKPKPQGDLYNMSFDLWSKGALYDNCYGPDADSDQQQTWDSVNPYLALLGTSVIAPETDFVAVAGEGKAALKLSSVYTQIGVFYGGCIFNGTLTNFEMTQYTASCGVPFIKRPLTLEGYACYQPKTIDYSTEPYKELEGKTDKGFVFVALTEWEAPYEVTPPVKLLDVENIPGLIGYGKVTFDHNMTEYEKFTATITYLNDHTPKYAVILATSSALGDYQTGADGSVLYLDELGFTYE